MGNAKASSKEIRHEEGAEARSLDVLVVEDDEINRMALGRFLTNKGMQVTGAANGSQALDLLRRKSFDCVLMDVRMPVMDGIEAVKRIRGSEDLRHIRGIPVIAVTAYAMQEERETMMAAGMDGCVTKPVRFEELLQVMGGLLGPGHLPAGCSP